MGGMRYQPQGRIRLARGYADKIVGGWVGSKNESNALGTASLMPTERFSAIRTETIGAEGVALTSNSASDVSDSISSLSINTSTLTRNSFTLIGVLRIRSTVGAGVGGRSNTNDILLWRNAGKYCFRVNNVTSTGPAMPLNTWLHYVLTSNSSGIYLSINGVEVIAAAPSASSATTGVPLELFEDTRAGGGMDMDMAMCALLSSGISREEAKKLSSNAWAMFAAPEEDYITTSVSDLIAAVIGSAYGTSYAASTGVSLSNSSGSANSTSNASGDGVAVSNASGESNSTSSSGTNGVALVATSGSANSLAVSVASAVSVWHVDGQVVGSSLVGAYSSSAINIVEVMGSAAGHALANAYGVSLFNVVANASGISSAYSSGVSIVASNGATVGGSTGQAGAIALANALGASSGSSTTQGYIAAVIHAQGFSVSVSDAQAAAVAINEAIGTSEGTCTVVGRTQGGVHYTAVGDKFGVTVVFAPYAISLEVPQYTIEKE